MTKKWLILSLIGGIWALIIFISSLFSEYSHTFSYLIISGGPIIGVIIGLFYDFFNNEYFCNTKLNIKLRNGKEKEYKV